MYSRPDHQASAAKARRAAQSRTRTLYLIKRLEQAVRQRLDDSLRRLGLTAQQYTTLTVLRARPGLSSAQLARRSFVTAQSMNEMVTALEKKGLMRRVPSEADRRVLQLTLTPRSTVVLATADRVVDDLEDRVITSVQGLSHDELRAVLFAAIDAISDDGGRGDALPDTTKPAAPRVPRRRPAARVKRRTAR